MTFSIILILISGASFVIYGISSFFSKKMTLEYERWGYPEQRLLIGGLQFLEKGLKIISAGVAGGWFSQSGLAVEGGGSFCNCFRPLSVGDT